MKKCPKCGIIKRLSSFHKNKRRSDGHAGHCKSCMKDHYLNNSSPSRRNTGIVDDRKKCSKCKEILDIGLFNKNKSRYDGYQGICKSCQCNIDQMYRQTENGKKRDLRYRLSDKGLISHQKAIKRYRQTDKYRDNSIYRSISGRMRYSLNNNKNGSWTDLVDWTIDDLKQHLEKMFVDGMSWDNYGEWHIDHIRPIASFDIVNEQSDNFGECWSLDNLQPLWAKDNTSKGAKWEGRDWRYE